VADRRITVAARFNGPPRSGNGGYTAGLVAAQLPDPGWAAQVTLRMPPPLDTPLQVTNATGGGVEAHHGDKLVAEAAPARLDAEPVPPVTWDQAVTASAEYPGFVEHPFPTCYVCGPERAVGDGLRIFPGPLPGGRTAAPWLVPAGVSALTAWAVLDCPGGWAIIGPGRPYVLGRMTARVLAVPPAGARCVVVGAVAATDGRKAQVGSALYDQDGELLAQARSTWIEIGH
jgi:hypothetical protein